MTFLELNRLEADLEGYDTGVLGGWLSLSGLGWREKKGKRRTKRVNVGRGDGSRSSEKPIAEERVMNWVLEITIECGNFA